VLLFSVSLLLINQKIFYMLQVNDKVKFHTPNSDEDPNQVYLLLEINGNRAQIEPINTGLVYAPILTVLLTDLIKA